MIARISPAPAMEHASTRLATDEPALEIDDGLFQRKFGREPFLIGHHLCEHPLFEVDRLLKLARTLPEACIEYNAGDLPLSVQTGQTASNGLSAEETIRRIRDCKSWLVLKHVERDADYAKLLEACLEIIRTHSEPIRPGMSHPHGFLFLSSPHSVTPYHIDPEHNFLLQIQGTKNVRMFDGRDRTILSETDLERAYSDSEHQSRNLQLDDSLRDEGWRLTLEPGFGLHFPVTFPHWVENDEDVSISFSITFRTPDLYRRQVLYMLNDRRRRRGLSPRPVGSSQVRDFFSFQTYRAGRRLAALFDRS